MRASSRWLAVCTGLSLSVAVAAAEAPGAAATRRQALLEAAGRGAAALPVLQGGLKDANPVVQRTAARLLADLGAPAQAALLEGWSSPDPVVRQTALKGLLKVEAVDAEAILGRALDDSSSPVRMMAVQALVRRPRTAGIEALLQKAAGDDDDTVRAQASRALWPFHRDVTPLRERPDWDHEVAVVQSLPLPAEGWRFALDPRRDGHLKKWHEADFDDSAWATIAIEQAWEKAGHTYDGVAWYRRQIEVPARPEGVINAVEIACDGVDECAWIWVNGVYVGQHDIGPAGWEKAFTLDITDALRWGATNQITVRVLDSTFAGGIWKPMRIEVLR